MNCHCYFLDAAVVVRVMDPAPSHTAAWGVAQYNLRTATPTLAVTTHLH